MSSHAGSDELVRESTPAVSRLREHALDGPHPQIGELRVQSAEGPSSSCSVVVIGEIDGAFLVGVPQTAWHRTAGRRYLPRTALGRTVLAEVLAASSEDPAAIRPGVKLKVWLGMLHQSLEDCIDFAVEGALEPDVPFLGFGSRSQERLDPYGPSLSAIASEHFAFLTPAEENVPGGLDEGEDAWETRLTRLESGMSQLQASLQLLVDGTPWSGEATSSAAAGVGPVPGSSAGVAKRPALAGLDPSVVEAARKAGVPEEQLVRMSQLATKGSGLPAGKAKAKARLPLLPEDPLDESDDDRAALGDGAGSAGPGDPIGKAVVQIGEVLKALHREREKRNDLEDLLDRAEGAAGDSLSGSTGGSRSKTAAYQKLRGALRSTPEHISSSIEGLMAEDFVGAQSGPHQEERRLTVRGWLEHRSHLQSYAGPIRQGWTLATIVDLINAGSVDQAKATALLALASLDQAAIDNGNWLLASEFAMDTAPPFGSFQRPRTLDALEAKQTKILDPRWISLFMARIRERDAFHAAKKNLSGGHQGGSGLQTSDGGGPRLEPDKPDKPPRKPPKGGGRGGKDKEKDGAK